jgi:sulfate/thiosulfate transport system permease protein
VTRRWPLRAVVFAYLSLLIVVPLGSVVYRAFSSGLAAAWHAITTPDALHALVLSLVVVAIAVPLDTVFGVGVALLLARRRFPGAALFDAAIDLPLAISPVVVGLALILCYGRTGWFGNWLAARGIEIIFSVPGIVMASAFVALPYVVRQVLPVLQELGTEKEQAAATLGAGWWRIFWRVTLPGIRVGLIYGITLTTARVLGEFGAVSVVSGGIAGKTQTLTLFVADQVDNLNPVGAYTAAVVLAAISLSVLLVLGRVSARKEHRWESTSSRLPSDSATLLQLTGSPSPSRPAR